MDSNAPCGGQVADKPSIDRGKQGTKRSMMPDRKGIPVVVIPAPANRNDSSLVQPTLELLSRFEDPYQNRSLCTCKLAKILAKSGLC